MKHVKAKQVFYKVQGECQASVIETQDGSFWILKLKDDGAPNLLFNEAFGSQLISHFHLPVATWMPVLLTDEFIDSNPTLWREGGKYSGRPSAGLHFGSKLIRPERGIGAFQVIPSNWISRVLNAEDFARILALDIWSNHCDRRQAIFTLAGDKLNATFIDNGNMFGGIRGGDLTCPRRAMMYDLRVYHGLALDKTLEAWRHKIEHVSERTLWDLLKTVPAAWYTEQRAERVIADLLLRRRVLPALFAEARETLRVGSTLHFDQFVGSIEARI